MIYREVRVFYNPIKYLLVGYYLGTYKGIFGNDYFWTILGTMVSWYHPKLDEEYSYQYRQNYNDNDIVIVIVILSIIGRTHTR